MNINAYKKTFGLDLPKSTYIDVVKNQKPALKRISHFTWSWPNWMKDLAQQLPNSCMAVFVGQLDGISSRFELVL